MNRKLFALILLSNTLCFSLFAQKTEIIKEPQRILNDAKALFNGQKYAAAYQQYVNYIDLVKQDNTVELSDAYYFKAISATNLENNDADKQIREFLNLFPNSARKNNANFYLANFYQKQNNYKDAIKTYNEIDVANLTKEQKFEYNYKLGYSYFNSGDLTTAKSYFAAIKDSKNRYSSPSIYYYAHILYSEKDYNAALKEFKELRNDRNFKGIVPYYIAQIYYLQEKYSELVKQAEELSQASNSKRTNETNRMLGEAYCKLERYEEAIPYLEKAVKDNPSATAEDNYLLGYTLCRSDKYAEAIPYLSKAIGNNDSLSQNALYNIGYSYLKTGDKTSARSSFQEAYKLDFDPQIKEDALLNFAKLSYELPNPFNETLKSFQLYYDTYPKSKKINEVKEYLAQLYGASKNYKDAIQLIEELPSRSKSINEAYQRIALNRGIEIFNEGEYREAIKLFNKSIENPFDNNLTAAAYFLRGESSYRLGNYEGAIRNLNSFYNVPNANKSIYYAKANYSMAYNYFKQKAYSKAQEYFNRYIKASKDESPKLISDAYNRMGDCHFMSKDFSNAAKEYDYVINANLIDVDYAIYQRALCTGAMGNIETKADIIQKALKEYPNSSYRASMLFELANCYLVLEQSEKALQTYNKVIEEYPQSIHAKACIGKVGMIYYKQGKDKMAVSTLDKLVKTYPSTEESKAGLKNIRSIYIDQNKVDEYYEYVKTVPNADFTVNEQDSITYEAAESVYMSGDCEKAIIGLQEYLNKFPIGYFSTNANYYLADCFSKQNKMDSALISYLFICTSPKGMFTEKAILNAANISYNNKNYKQADELYKRLEKESEINNHKSLAQIGIMRSDFYLNNFDTAIVYAQKVLSIAKNTTATNDEANYIIAKSYLELGDTIKALDIFKQLKKSKNGDYSGEANYVFAENAFTNKKYDQAEKQILAISSNPTSEYWLAKSIILLGDVYVKKNKNLLAKQTYQSIVENYEGKDLVEICNNKIKTIDNADDINKVKEEKKAQEKNDEVDEIIIDRNSPSANNTEKPLENKEPSSTQEPNGNKE
ncbi:MAG: tetratricopeptide repeat protein [Bacteroidales bacterium]|jgi:TolA-binding protein